MTSTQASSTQDPAGRFGEYEMTYCIVREAWYYQVAPEHMGTTVLDIGLHHREGGCLWEFTMTEEDLGRHGRCLRLGVFDESWEAFTTIPEFFTALAALGKGATVEEVVDLMVGLGYRDVTKRENPHQHSGKRTRGEAGR